jgi:ATP-dependent 26S proteasome regulatory subunit
MNVSPDVNYDELARSTDDFNAAQLKAVSEHAGRRRRADGSMFGGGGGAAGQQQAEVGQQAHSTACGAAARLEGVKCNLQSLSRSHTCPLPLQVCVEAGMLALRRDATQVNHEDFNEAITEVQAKKKANLNYYA